MILTVLAICDVRYLCYMSKSQWHSDDDEIDWEEIEKVTRNFKGSADEIEDILIDEIRPSRKKKKRFSKFFDEET